MRWQGRSVLVTGGASFIGSHLVDALLGRGAAVRVVDDLSSGRVENLLDPLATGRVELLEGDLVEPGVARHAVRDMDLVFHLAAIHGGRGFLETQESACARNLHIDAVTFDAAQRAGVEKLVFASSGCVYPMRLQEDPASDVRLREDMVGPPFEADGIYGWAKLMGELTLAAYARDGLLKSASCRFFTVYGERAKEDHALLALIARAFLRQDPYDIWGDGRQVRNWTHVRDIVDGLLLAAERIDDGSAVNLGTEERVRVIDAAREILRYTRHAPEIRFLDTMPTGPLNRVACADRARRILGWEPAVDFKTGLHATIDWYFANRDRAELGARLDEALLQRTAG